jgi:thioredoxin 1
VKDRQDLLVLSVDVDEQQALAQRFGVLSVPTMIAFKSGRPVGQLVGNASRSTIEKLLGG